jgi:N-acetylmuramoyl-L-alanine amidase
VVFFAVMAPEPMTRRRALGASAAALAASALAPPAALARRPAPFELALDGEAAATAASWRTTEVLRAPRRFDLLGLRWSAGAVDAQVRARTRHGGWTPWVPLHRAGDHAPDGARRPTGTEPAWTDSADLFQLRLRGSARGLRVRFVRAKPTATVAGGVARRLRRRASASARGAQAQPPPAGAVAPPRIITRSEWGGDSVPPRAAAAYGEVHLSFVHHTVTANDYAPEDSASIVLGIARYHRDTNGWNDIGYNFLVDKYGQVFEGRAGGMELAVIGAQAQGFNSASTGVACLGDFRAIPQSDAGIAALAQLLAWKHALHGIPAEGTLTVTSQGGETNRYRSGTPVTFQRISGHRDGDQTTCPGDLLYGQLPGLRDEVARRLGQVASSGLSVKALTRRVRFPSPVKLSGRLRFGDGSPAAGVGLTLEYQPRGGTWQPVGSASTGADGSWTSVAAVPASGLVRAVFEGDPGRGPLRSPGLSVTVLPRLTLQLSARRIHRRASVRVRGTLNPPPAGNRVLCILERQVAGRWVVVGRKRIDVRGGGFDTRVRPRLAGLHRITISAPGATKRLQVRVVSAASATGGATAG